MNRKWFIKILFIILFVLIDAISVFSADLLLNLNYGINNTAKSGRLLPLNISVMNREEKAFEGNILISIYESNMSVYNYEYDITINPRDIYEKSVDISIADKSNTIVIDIVDTDRKVVVSDRLNIDLSSLESRLLVGVISANPSQLNYFDTIALKNGNVHTKTVILNVSDFLINRKLLSQFDCLLLSGIDMSLDDAEYSALNAAIEDFLNEGKIVILGTGNFGTLSFPKTFFKYLTGPSFLENISLDLNGKWTNNEKIYPDLSLNITNYNIKDERNVFNKNNKSIIKSFQIGNGIVACAAFDFCDINSLLTINNSFIVGFIEEIFGAKRLEQLESNDLDQSLNNYNSIKSLVDVADSMNLPDIMMLSFIIVIYVLTVLIIVYAILRNKKQLYFYSEVVVVISLVFLVALITYTNQYKRQKTFLTFCDITELSTGTTNEKTILNFITSENSNFSFNTSANNTLYPLLKSNNRPIDISDNNNDSMKVTHFKTIDNVQYIDVNNSTEFDSNIFIYENRNDLNSYYNFDINVNYYNNNVLGRVTNKSDFKLYDASILLNGKVIYIGDIEKDTSISLNRAQIYNSPINNNKMISDFMCYFPRNRVVEYYLNNSIYGYFDNAKFFAFIDKNNTLDIMTKNINEVYGLTMLVKNVSVNYVNNDMTDLSAMSNNIVNLYGSYDADNNSIIGNSEVINEYYLDNNYEYFKIYYNNIYENSSNNIYNNASYYGNVSIYNFNTEVYDDMNGAIDENVEDYLSENNSFIVKFNPTGKDILERNIGLPMFRVIGEKYD